MKFFSFLGSEEFFLILLPVVYWCVDTNIGLRVGAIVLFSGSVNEILKLSFHQPRPYWFSTKVRAYAAETSFGFPSGHAQIAAGLWGMAAAMARRWWAWLLAAFIVLMIGLSRLYLAVHFPQDVLMGWLIGGLILWVFTSWWEAWIPWLKSRSLKQQMLLAFAVSTIILIPGIVALNRLRGWVIPVEWLVNAQNIGLDSIPAPVSLNTTITSAAALFGMLIGLAWINSKGGFNADGSFDQRALRLFPGLVGILIFYLGLRFIFPQGDFFIAYLFRYVRFALVGMWISAGAPWTFQKLNLVRAKRVDEYQVGLQG